MRKLEPFPALLLFVGFCLLLARVLAGCAAAQSPKAKAGGYEAELLACTEQAATLRESVTCENAVRARWHRPLRPMPEGGAP
jgi:hypothetical protein